MLLWGSFSLMSSLPCYWIFLEIRLLPYCMLLLPGEWNRKKLPQLCRIRKGKNGTLRRTGSSCYSCSFLFTSPYMFLHRRTLHLHFNSCMKLNLSWRLVIVNLQETVALHKKYRKRNLAQEQNSYSYNQSGIGISISRTSINSWLTANAATTAEVKHS